MEKLAEVVEILKKFFLDILTLIENFFPAEEDEAADEEPQLPL